MVLDVVDYRAMMSIGSRGLDDFVAPLIDSEVPDITDISQ